MRDSTSDQVISIGVSPLLDCAFLLLSALSVCLSPLNYSFLLVKRTVGPGLFSCSLHSALAGITTVVATINAGVC